MKLCPYHDIPGISPILNKVLKAFAKLICNVDRQIEQQNNKILEIAANAGGGGGGVALESYQNSVMSAAVEAYVFRDENDNIFRVYEPIRNNDVSRSVFAYADSIDKVPFDNVDWFGNRIDDVKLIDLNADAIMQGCILSTMIITANSKTGLQLISHKQTGNYGTTALGIEGTTEIYITGNDVIFKKNKVEGGEAASCFFRVGANSTIKNNVIGTEVGFNCYDRALQLFRATMSNEIIVDVATDNAGISLCDINGECAILTPIGGMSNSFLENSAHIYRKIISSHQITAIDSENKKLTIAGDQSASNANILFVDTGNDFTNGYYKIEDITYDEGNDVSEITVLENINEGIEIGNDLRLYHHFTGITKSKFGVNSQTGAGANISIESTTIGAGVGSAGPDPFDPTPYQPTTDLANTNIINIGEAYYELGVTDGAVTATPI